MAVVAVLLATVVAANIAESPGSGSGPGDPRASFTFATENSTVVVTHYGGDALDPEHVYVESGTRGRLGNFDGSAGMACTRNLTTVERGSTCRVPNSSHERLYVVWDAGENRSLILARRGADPTPSPSPTQTPNVTVSPTPATTTTAPGTASPATQTPPTQTGTPTSGTPTGNETTPGTETGTPGTPATPTNGTGTPTGTPTATPAGTPTETPAETTAESDE